MTSALFVEVFALESVVFCLFLSEESLHLLIIVLFFFKLLWPVPFSPSQVEGLGFNISVRLFVFPPETPRTRSDVQTATGNTPLTKSLHSHTN